MKFVTFQRGSDAMPGVWLDDQQIFELSSSLGFATLIDFIDAGSKALTEACALAARPPASSLIKSTDVTLLAPIPRPRKNVFAVGRNYSDHVAEGQRASGVSIALPEHPQYFSIPPTAVIGPEAGVRHDPGVSDKLDYEVELGVVIGKTARDIAEADVFDHVFGYTIINDVTARDLQRRHDQWFKGKGLDTFCPMGPWIVDKGDIADPHRLQLSMRVNGEVRQNANTETMIFKIPRIVSALSQGMTLEAGDVIATGTPSGVGYAMNPPHFLKPGDEMECRIEGIGVLRNRVVSASRN